MEKNIYLKGLGLLKRMLYLLITALVFGACNEDFPDLLSSKTTANSEVNNKDKKVLYIIMDGVRGRVLPELVPAPPVIASLTEHALYSFDALTGYQDSTTQQYGDWTTMMTGVSANKHMVFKADFSSNTHHSLFSRLKSVKPSFRTVSVASSQAFSDNLAADATTNMVFENDDAKVKDAVIAELNSQNPDFVVAQFHSTEIAGKTYGYTSTTPQYADAIRTVDAYIGEILESLNNRENKDKEDWLVVIASSRGGITGTTPATGKDKNPYALPERNSFVIFYHPALLPESLVKPDINAIPYTGYAARFVGNDGNNNKAECRDNDLGDLGTDKEMTFTCKIRVNKGTGGNNPPILGKKVKASPSDPGWILINARNANELKLIFDDGGINNQISISAGKFKEGEWITFGFKVYKEGANRKVKVFANNELLNSGGTVISSRVISSSTPLTFGRLQQNYGNGGIDVLIEEVALWEKTLPDGDIIAVMEKGTMEENDKHYSTLRAYWPCDPREAEEEKSLIVDVIKKNANKSADLVFTKDPNWPTYNDLSPVITPLFTDNTYKLVPNTADLPVQIYTWLRVPPLPAWELDGRYVKLKYKNIIK